jgi:hypothetical protein
MNIHRYLLSEEEKRPTPSQKLKQTNKQQQDLTFPLTVSIPFT